MMKRKLQLIFLTHNMFTIWQWGSHWNIYECVHK